jgi:hypothetical protein
MRQNAKPILSSKPSSQCKNEGKVTLEPTKQTEEKRRKINPKTMIEHSVSPYNNSWWNISKIPGKMIVNQKCIGGIPTYGKYCHEKTRVTGWHGLDIVAAA